MLSSIGLILGLGIISIYVSKKLGIPSLVIMLVGGIIIGPSILNLLDAKTLSVSSELRNIALIIILLRAGLGLKINDLKNFSLNAYLLCFLPASFEIIGSLCIGYYFFNLSIKEALLVGSILAAVSPAVVVPRMLKFIEKSNSKTKTIYQTIMAGASVDDIFVIVCFTSFLNLNKGNAINFIELVLIPFSIVSGILLGFVVGQGLKKFLKMIELNSVYKTLIVLSTSFLVLFIQDYLKGFIPVSALLSIMTMGVILNEDDNLSRDLKKSFNNLWQVFEILLFVLVGACVFWKHLLSLGIVGLFYVLGCLIFRGIGVIASLFKTKYSFKEKLFILVSYSPKATVQATIGSIPLSMGLACGNFALTIAVLAIVVTAPIGAYLIDKCHTLFLNDNI